jgi:hypothetical protein
VTGGDTGSPVATGDGPLREVFDALAAKVVDDLAPVIEVAGCSARMLDNVEQAVRSFEISESSSSSTASAN